MGVGADTTSDAVNTGVTVLYTSVGEEVFCVLGVTMIRCVPGVRGLGVLGVVARPPLPPPTFCKVVRVDIVPTVTALAGGERESVRVWGINVNIRKK